MSLINETLQNLHKNDEKAVRVLFSKSRKVFRKIFTHSSPQNFLIGVISLGIILALFYISYYSQINQYFYKAKEYFTNQSGRLASNVYEMKDKIHLSVITDKNKDSSLANKYSSSVQIQYYNAMNLLNEGNAYEARKSLRDILQENPDFTPAKQAMSMLNTRLK